MSTLTVISCWCPACEGKGIIEGSTDICCFCEGLKIVPISELEVWEEVKMKLSNDNYEPKVPLRPVSS